MELQDFLRKTPDALKILKEEYLLKVKTHPKYPNLHLFKYNQLFSPMREKMCQEARGCILDAADDWKVISRPFDKFWNEGEQLASKIDWDTARVQEKLDGSLMCLYWYDGGWQVQSSGTPDAGGQVGGLAKTFEELFLGIWHDTNMGSFPSSRFKNFTFMFEMMSLYNRVVISHNTPKIVLIGIRNNDTGQELTLDNKEMHLDYPKVKEFPLQTLAQINEVLVNMSPFGTEGQEGYVVVDANFNRIKCKSPAYVAAHHAIDHFGPKRAIELILAGETTEVLVYFPEYATQFADILSKFNKLIDGAYRAWEGYIPPAPLVGVDPSSKAAKDLARARFADYATKTKFSPALFYQYSNKGTIKDFYFSRSSDYLLDCIGLKDKPKEEA